MVRYITIYGHEKLGAHTLPYVGMMEIWSGTLPYVGMMEIRGRYTTICGYDEN